MHRGPAGPGGERCRVCAAAVLGVYRNPYITRRIKRRTGDSSASGPQAARRKNSLATSISIPRAAIQPMRATTHKMRV